MYAKNVKTVQDMGEHWGMIWSFEITSMWHISMTNGGDGCEKFPSLFVLFEGFLHVPQKIKKYQIFYKT